MKNYKTFLSFLFFITLSSGANAQVVVVDCNFVPPEFYEQCMADNGGNQQTAEVKYAVGTTGDIAIATQEDVIGGYAAKVYFVQNGSSQINLIKEFELGSSISAMKAVENKIILTLSRRVGLESAISVRVLEKDALGVYVESEVFPEYINDTQSLTKYVYSYNNLTIQNGSVYVGRNKTTYFFSTEECPPETICTTPDPNFPTSVTQEIVYLKRELNSPTVEIVPSIPGNISPPRYSFTVQNDNIYRYDSETGTNELWLQNNNEAGRNLRDLVVVGNYLFFTSTTDIGDGPTNLIAVKVTDAIPHPEKRLATNLAGTLLISYHLDSNQPSFEIASFDIYQKGVRAEKYSLSDTLDTNRFTELDVKLKVIKLPEFLEDGGTVEIFMVAEGEDEKRMLFNHKVLNTFTDDGETETISYIDGLIGYSRLLATQVSEVLQRNEDERLIQMKIFQDNANILPKLTSEYEGKVKIKIYAKYIRNYLLDSQKVDIDEKELTFSINECNGFTHEGNNWISSSGLKFDSQSRYNNLANKSHANGVYPSFREPGRVRLPDPLIAKVGCNLTSLTNALKILGGRNYSPANSGDLGSFRSPFINYLSGIAVANNLDSDGELLDPQLVDVFNNAQYEECLVAGCESSNLASSKIIHKAVYHQDTVKDFELAYVKQALNSNDDLAYENTSYLGNYFALRGFQGSLTSSISLFGYGNSSKAQAKESICGSARTKIATKKKRGIAVLRTLQLVDATSRVTSPDSPIDFSKQHYVLAVGTVKSSKNSKLETFQIVDPLEIGNKIHPLDSIRQRGVGLFDYSNVVRGAIIYSREGFYPYQQVASFYKFINSLKLINSAYAQESSEISTIISTRETSLNLIIKNKLGAILYDSTEDPMISHENGFTRAIWGGETAPDCDNSPEEICSLPERLSFSMDSTPLEELEFIFKGSQNPSFDISISTIGPDGELLESKELTLSADASGSTSLIEFGGVDPIQEGELKIKKIHVKQLPRKSVLFHIEGRLKDYNGVINSTDNVDIYAQDLLDIQLSGERFKRHKNVSIYKKLAAKEIELFTIDKAGNFVLLLKTNGSLTSGSKEIYIKINDMKYAASTEYINNNHKKCKKHHDHKHDKNFKKKSSKK